MKRSKVNAAPIVAWRCSLQGWIHFSCQPGHDDVPLTAAELSALKWVRASYVDELQTATDAASFLFIDHCLHCEACDKNLCERGKKLQERLKALGERADSSVAGAILERGEDS